MATGNPLRAQADPVRAFAIDASARTGGIGHLYNIGYDGWGDIFSPAMVGAFDALGVKYCRIRLDLPLLCGAKPGDFDWSKTADADIGKDFVTRLRQIRANGWVPLVAFSYHGGVRWLPPGFHGDRNDENGNAWTRYNRDGTKVSEGFGDQMEAAETIAEQAVAYLVSRGFSGMRYETIYEMGADMPLTEIHHAVASGIRRADKSAFIMGPATWPGWTLEEKFIKPYLQKYGPELLDGVSAHWYGSNDHDFLRLMQARGDGTLTMDDAPALALLMKNTPLFQKWTASAGALLKDRALNPSGKSIGMAFTEIDVNAESYYQRNPENPRWPDYDARADCWLNGNYFGGVWWASVLGHIAAAGSAADAFKFTGRSYFGVQDAAGDGVCRYPVWFAFRLLGGEGGFRPPRGMLAVSAAAPADDMLEVFANAGDGDVRVLVVNKSPEAKTAQLSVARLPPGPWKLTRFLYDRGRVAHFQGRRPGDGSDGVFSGSSDARDADEPVLHPVSARVIAADGAVLRLPPLECPPVSFQILVLQRANAPAAR